MTRLAARIAEMIAAQGPITIAQYMALALADLREGYYRRRNPIGIRGDFTTAPEISQIFGELVGASLAGTWLDMGRPLPFTFAELGPGRGTLAADALRATRKLPGWIDGMEVHLVESNLALRARQDEKLAIHTPFFHDTIDTLPESRPIFAIANEFLDCLPIHQFQRTEHGWNERLIGIDERQNLCLRLDHRTVQLPHHQESKPGQVLETSPAREALISQLAALIKAQGGMALIIDYGSFGNENGDTFQAVRAHKKTNPLEHVGQSDLTSHVIFEPLAKAAQKTGCQVFGPIQQSVFLNRLGAAERYEKLTNDAPNHVRDKIASGLGRILDPDGMGSLFKVMAITSKALPSGFLEDDEFKLHNEVVN